MELVEEKVLSETEAYETERGKPMPSKNHARIQTNLILELAPFKDKFSILSEINVLILGSKKVPDLAIFKELAFDFWHDETLTTEIPLATIEILSPSQGIAELIEKTDEYFAAGVKSCWIVLPSLKTIYVCYSADNFKIFSVNETLIDENLEITISLSNIFC